MPNGREDRTGMLPPFDPWLASSIAIDVLAASSAADAALGARRDRRLEALLAAAATRSPLYRELLGDRPASAGVLVDLPVVRKADLMRQFERWVADPAIRLDALRRFLADRSAIGAPFLGRYAVWESSGSSGEPAAFVQDAAAFAVYDALEAIRRPRLVRDGLLDPWGATERYAFVGAIDGHFASVVSLERLRRLNPWLAPRLHGISFLQPIAGVVAELHRYAPTVLSTYPTAAVVLAEERLAGRLRLAPAAVWTGGETLSPAMRAFVSEAFGCPVVNSYGSSEFLSLAGECRLGALHLNSDWAILEPVDEQGRRVPAGTAGATTLLTNLANHVQPLLRYDIGDRVVLHSESCACGSRLPVIDVEGRCDDTVLLGNDAHATVRLLPLALSTVLEEEAGLFDFQLVQTAPAALALCTRQHGADADAALRRGRSALLGFLARQGVGAIAIRCRSGTPPRPGRTGKLMRVVGLTSSPAASRRSRGRSPR
jgi:phenylacetate-CoA ligase